MLAGRCGGMGKATFRFRSSWQKLIHLPSTSECLARRVKEKREKEESVGESDTSSKFMLPAARARKTTRRSRHLNLLFFFLLGLEPVRFAANRQKTEEREVVDVLAAVEGVGENAFHIQKHHRKSSFELTLQQRSV